MPKLYLVRHGQTDWNAEGRLQGQSDRRLNGIGQEQAAAIARRLATVRLDAIYSSNLSRALATAIAIATPHGLPVNLEPRLRELSYGRWEGYTHTELARLYPEAVERWHATGVAPAEMDGETREQAAERLSSFIDELREHGPTEQIAVVSHGAALRVLLSVLSPWPEGHRGRQVVGTASLTIVALSPADARILLLDDRSHIVEREPAYAAGGGE